MFILMWIFLWLNLLEVQGYIETVIVSGCESCKLYLTCRHLTSIIGILEADFVQENETTTPNDTLVAISTPFPPYHPRHALNKRCSGVNHCSFILTEDCPGADSWGFGNLTVKYVCVSGNEITKFCNTEIILPESGDVSGFIHNVGYPRFYSSERECHWKIRTKPEQRIKLTVLDIALTADRTYYPEECSDYLEFLNSEGQVIDKTCKPLVPPYEIISESEFLEIVLVSTHSLIPLRGVLLYYTAIGCPTLDAPDDGYLIYRNETSAEYSCCVNLVFEDSGKKTKTIHCIGAKWDINLPLPNCTRQKNHQNQLLPLGEIRETSEMASDILAPALIIAALFLINFIVLFYIYKIKQKHAIEFADEELGTLQELHEKAMP